MEGKAVLDLFIDADTRVGVAGILAHYTQLLCGEAATAGQLNSRTTSLHGAGRLIAPRQKF